MIAAPCSRPSHRTCSPGSPPSSLFPSFTMAGRTTMASPTRLLATLVLAMLATIAVAPRPAAAHEAARIIGFWLVDPRTGKWMARLNRNSVIDLSDGPVAIAAMATSARSHAIVWTSPKKYARRERFAPFSLGGDYDGLFRALKLKPGALKLSAYVSDGTRVSKLRARTLTVKVVRT